MTLHAFQHTFQGVGTRHLVDIAVGSGTAAFGLFVAMFWHRTQNATLMKSRKPSASLFIKPEERNRLKLDPEEFRAAVLRQHGGSSRQRQ